MISVCLAAYNGERYIKEQVDSILAQLGPTDELIVSDDGSTDATVEILASYGDIRIKVFHNSGRKGVVGNFENALSLAEGDYIFLSDQDDLWLPNKVAACLDALQHADLVLHDAVVWDGKQVLLPSFFGYRGVRRGYVNNMIRNSYIGCCMCFRKCLLDKALPFPKRVAIHDMYLGLVGERSFRVAFLCDPLIYYRRHGNNASQTGEKSKYSVFYRIKYRFHMFKATINR